jgi:hypothetical protein
LALWLNICGAIAFSDSVELLCNYISLDLEGCFYALETIAVNLST